MGQGKRTGNIDHTTTGERERANVTKMSYVQLVLGFRRMLGRWGVDRGKLVGQKKKPNG